MTRCCSQRDLEARSDLADEVMNVHIASETPTMTLRTWKRAPGLGIGNRALFGRSFLRQLAMTLRLTLEWYAVNDGMKGVSSACACLWCQISRVGASLSADVGAREDIRSDQLSDPASENPESIRSPQPGSVLSKQPNGVVHVAVSIIGGAVFAHNQVPSSDFGDARRRKY